eukprot:COSAG02_NODE_55677_length_289_cov_0.815789_2_plen_21_part_01
MLDNCVRIVLRCVVGISVVCD